MGRLATAGRPGRSGAVAARRRQALPGRRPLGGARGGRTPDAVPALAARRAAADRHGRVGAVGRTRAGRDLRPGPGGRGGLLRQRPRVVRVRGRIPPHLRWRDRSELGRRSDRSGGRSAGGRRPLHRDRRAASQGRGKDARVGVGIVSESHAVVRGHGCGPAAPADHRIPADLRPAPGNRRGHPARSALGRGGRPALEPGHGHALHGPTGEIPQVRAAADRPALRLCERQDRASRTQKRGPAPRLPPAWTSVCARRCKGAGAPCRPTSA